MSWLVLSPHVLQVAYWHTGSGERYAITHCGNTRILRVDGVSREVGVAAEIEESARQVAYAEPTARLLTEKEIVALYEELTMLFDDTSGGSRIERNLIEFARDFLRRTAP